MTLDSTFLPLAERLINDFGKVVIFTEKSLPDDYDRDLGEVIPAAPAQTFTAKVSPPDSYNKFFVDGDLIRVGDLKVLLSNQGNSFIPEEGWTITLDNSDFKIVNVKPFYSGELIAVWELRLRQ